MQKYKLKNTNMNRVYYVLKHGHCLAELYTKYCVGKVYTLYNKTDSH